MKRLSVLGAALAMLAFGVAGATAAPVTSSVVYNAIPSSLPGNVASVGFEATSTSQFGDRVHLARADRVLQTVTVTLSDWALYSDYSSDARYSGNSATWSHPITINVYSSHLGANGAPDTLLASRTQPVSIPWRPPAVAGCGTAWKATDGQCYNGMAFNAAFDLSSQNVTLPSDVIVGVAYNTADYGAAPIHQAGPYNSLNVGVPTGQTATVGSDDNADNVFWNTSFGGFYADGGPGGSFRQDTGWTPNGTMALQVTAGSGISINNIPANATFGGSFTPTFAYAGDGATSVKSNTPGVCSVSSGVVSFVGAGPCTLQAHATATATSLEATGAQQTFTVAKGTTTVSVNNIPTSAIAGKSFTANFDYAGIAGGNQGITLTSSTPATCTVAAGSRSVKFVGAGTCTLTAHAAATANYLATNGSPQSFTITLH